MWWYFTDYLRTTPKGVRLKTIAPARSKSWDTLIDMRKVFDQTTLAPHTADCVESKDAR